ncbi:type III restriction-modification system endonuclease [Riemerella anatipestifer]|uniref:Restriction endonuclease n=2 Tax=Riemerella anatipestifer TaxID=34085 RepID=J9R3Z6_RIEAN|nr:DEAD/DEAH box helicase family protein [Riemerella anatipestifer]AFR36589.1 Restriction endonuclease [Riemerella anatipestifer RA-CH-1]MCO7331378.1 DEAD/DEAH box helicase family protein [Riemerella anatipestifer]MCO7350151.1 DEAD/DEAH box helicase family protein [Riemerella anatipestifer]MCU7582173.1 DEAD/DEAH box helicase family protein [Riemerella anatipestifer]MCW0493023.1 DEAD/DEAH box helicase family protein [Riemerella anatipestifer]
MKLQFKEQDFQVKAVQAVVNCFEEQPIKTNRFTLERSKELIKKAKQAASGIQSLDFEVEEEIGYRNASIQLTEAQILRNIQEVQKQNDLLESQQIEHPKGVKIGYNLTIEMETGTGKTYTYIRTMYELHKKYGWSKFIVIVPSIAIREGVYKSFQVTQEHFQELYGHKINPFIYNSSRPQDIENFASDSRISVMIINTQAFNARGNDARRIYQELDQFGTRKPIEIIAQTNPILIIDEPQSVDGEKTLESMQDFNPLFTLRYSATHKVEYNKIYRLDALDAYKKRLVKKIQVKGISVKGQTGTEAYFYLQEVRLSTNKPPKAVIEIDKRQGAGVVRKIFIVEQGARLFELSGELPAYKNLTIQNIDGQRNCIELNNDIIYAGEILNDKNENDFRRVQIRECILSHLQKEKQLFGKGIKVLSLFFIDTVEKYRVYDEFGEQQLGEYAKIFEEEYDKLKNNFIDLFEQEYNDYLIDTDTTKIHKGYMPTNFGEYLKRDEASQVHNGYFSIDKKGKSVDPTTKKGKEDSEDVSAYDLIMKDKERLLSFEEPTRFIFSHSALKEGWDNPNVFQICALKHAESGSLTRRRQEVGRGMRLCVDKRGVRQDFELIGDQVHELNKLTIIASESYESFAKGLQKEIANTLKDRPQKAEVEYFVSKVVKNEQGGEYRITKEDAKKLNKLLYKNDIIDEDDKITVEGREIIESGTIPLPDNLEPYKDSVCQLLQSIYTGTEFKPEDERQTIILNPNKNFSKKEFQALWDKINLKTIYEVQFDTEKLIKEAVIKIDAQLNIGDRVYQVLVGELEDGTAEQMKEGILVRESKRQYTKLDNNLYTDTFYDIVGEIETLTSLTRRTIVEILKKISPKKFALIQKNPEEFIAKSSKLINEVKASLIINNIVYHKTEERHDAKTVFTNDKTVLRKSELLEKHIYDFLTSDSKIESNFAKALETSTEVIVYAKLPKSFYISTPVANYSPDWAIVFDKDKVRHIYFVTETKGSDSDMDLREIEKLKIHCATEHFKEISNAEVKFEKVSSYDKLMDIVQLK